MPELLNSSPGSDNIDTRIKDAMTNFIMDSTSPAIAYVSKMVAMPESELPQNKRRGGNAMSPEEARELARKKRAEIAKAQAAAVGGVDSLASSFSHATIDSEYQNGEEPSAEDPEHLIGFARLYSGTLKVGDEIYALPPKFNPTHPKAHPTPKKVKVEALYLLMGRSLESLQEVPAGVVFGIEGLEGAILKNGTLSTQLEGSPNMAAVASSLTTTPIVRVALEPENPGDLDKMIRGLKMLEQSDPCAVYEVLESGEHVLATAGELHLERCLKDLRERFARCEITAGEPIVPYRETIVKAEEMNAPRDPQLPRGTVVADTSSKQVQVRLRVRPLPEAVSEFLAKNAASIKHLYAERHGKEQGSNGSNESDAVSYGPKDEDAVAEADNLLETGNILTLDDFKSQLQSAFAEAKAEKDVWNGVVDKIAAFGPKRTGPNLFIDATDHGCCTKA
jgi:ribosome assembly protein 1